MNIIPNLSAMQKWRSQTDTDTIAFVPTMGGLHEGHLSLVALAKQAADRVVVSIFVNPAQFAPHEDFAAYPRVLERDLALLEQAGVDAVFTPSVEVMYPDGASSSVDVGEIGQILCGQSRPHFFNGVVQVVRRLFAIVRPDVAIFGQKDYQQLHIIKRFTSGVEIVAGAIVREADGLAMSTRNQYLSMNERQIAPRLHQVLHQVQQDYLRNEAVSEVVAKAKNTLANDFKVDYLALLDANTLKQITGNTRKIAILCAVFLGSTRLIDNIIFNQG